MQTDDTLELTLEDKEAIEEGIRSEREDPRCTIDEAVEFARANRDKWAKNQTA